ALIGYHPPACLYERRAVFEQCIQPCHGARAARIELFVVINVAAGILCPHVDNAHARKFQLLRGQTKEGAFFADALELSKRKVVPGYLQRNGGKAPARTHLRDFGTIWKIAGAGQTVAYVFYKELAALR